MVQFAKGLWECTDSVLKRSHWDCSVRQLALGPASSVARLSTQRLTRCRIAPPPPKYKKVCFFLANLKARHWLWQDTEGLQLVPFRLWMRFKYRGMSASPVLMDVCVWWFRTVGGVHNGLHWRCSAAEGGFCKPGLSAILTLRPCFSLILGGSQKLGSVQLLECNLRPGGINFVIGKVKFTAPEFAAIWNSQF